MDTNQYLDAFLTETEDNLSALSTLCLKLEQEGSHDDLFAAMFRAAHTLKGMSATMGYTEMANLTHHMEDALGHVRSHLEAFEPVVVDILFEAIDALSSNLQAIRDDGSEQNVDHDAVLARLTQVFDSSPGALLSGTASVGMDEAVFDILRSLDEQGHEVGVLEVTLASVCVMKGVRMVMMMRIMDEFGDVLSSSPDAQTLQDGDFDGAVQVAVVLARGTLEELASSVREMMEVESVDIIDWRAGFQAVQEIGASLSNVAEQAVNSGVIALRPTEDVPVAAVPKSREQTLRVPIGRIDEFMNVLSELIIAKTRLELISRTLEDPSLRDVSEQITRLAESLQDGVMNMRMMPVESLFQRFPRMMRDLQKSLGREFDFQMTGLDTEMDRTVMDEMGEALVHLLRNAADHGLESPDDREANGKPRRGTIRLSAYASGGHVYLEVADDGSGIHRDGVLKSAVGKGIVDARKAAEMTDAQVHELLFASGFSTAQIVSDISGRGVGLDAVRGKVESLGGDIRIDSVAGQGTTFVIELPLTLTVLPAMLVRIGSDMFALPTGNILEVSLLSAEEVESVHEQPVLKYRDGVIPILDLGRYFYEKSCQRDYPWTAVICKEGNRYMALAVDDVVDELEVVNKPLGKYLEHVNLFAGATILGDGDVALIIDVHQLFQVKS